MKRSEFVTKRQDHWFAVIRAGDDPGASACTLAARDAVAADVAGVQWDSEEPELPKSVCISDYGFLMDDEENYWARFGDFGDEAVRTYKLSPARRREIASAVLDAYNRLQAGELTPFPAATDAVLRGIDDRCQMRALLNEAEDMVQIQREHLGALEDALSRLARGAGVPDEGPDAIVNAVLAEMERLASRCNRMASTLYTIERAAAEGRK